MKKDRAKQKRHGRPEGKRTKISYDSDLHKALAIAYFAIGANLEGWYETGMRAAPKSEKYRDALARVEAYALARGVIKSVAVRFGVTLNDRKGK